MSRFTELKEHLDKNQYTWLVTGAAGFIGSNLSEYLLEHNQKVVGLDNLSTGLQSNVDSLKNKIFRFIKGDICNISDCEKAIEGVDYVLHQAALGSVPRSIKDPIASHQVNVDGFINMLWVSQQAKVKKFVYASSSSVYGDHPDLPKLEGVEGKVLSPYAATKQINELYAEIFCKTYHLPVIGLRYFNVFGQRQRPDGPYAAVLPKWVGLLLDDKGIEIYGDGETSRDFCYIENVIQMNLLSALSENADAENQVYNVAYGAKTSLNELYEAIKSELKQQTPKENFSQPEFKDFRAGDVKHSLADIGKAQKLLGYEPEFDFSKGLHKAIGWYVESHQE